MHYGLRPIERGQFRFFRFCMKMSLSLSNCNGNMRIRKRSAYWCFCSWHRNKLKTKEDMMIEDKIILKRRRKWDPSGSKVCIADRWVDSKLFLFWFNIFQIVLCVGASHRFLKTHSKNKVWQLLASLISSRYASETDFLLQKRFSPTRWSWTSWPA